ncbi:MAG TPA: hypothetical protein VMT99_03955 [Candidatus Paceibacterota bacterium]|nr:hypothetical protein [Candidatus Paceibacterota bacterium]
MKSVIGETLCRFDGAFKQLVTNLLGDDAEAWGGEFEKFLRREPCWIPVAVDPQRPPFPVWKTVRTQVRGSGEELVAELLAQGFLVYGRARHALATLSFDRPMSAECVLAFPAELGITKEYTNGKTVHEAAAAHGLKPVPAEVVPFLRLQYPEQPTLNAGTASYVYVGMSPIKIYRRPRSVILVLNHQRGQPSLGACFLGELNSIRSKTPWVFAR